jgi:hypothetical protein
MKLEDTEASRENCCSPCNDSAGHRSVKPGQLMWCMVDGGRWLEERPQNPGPFSSYVGAIVLDLRATLN